MSARRTTTLRRAYDNYRTELEELIPFERGESESEQRYEYLKRKLDLIEREARLLHGFSAMREYEESHDVKVKCYQPPKVDVNKLIELMNE